MTFVVDPYRFGVIAPYSGTNLLTSSNNFTTGWNVFSVDISGSPGYSPVLAVVSAGGIGGEDSTTVEDNSTASLEYVYKWYDNTAGDTNDWCARYFVKKTTGATPPFCELHLRFSASTTNMNGDGTALGFDSDSGSVSARLAGTGMSNTVNTYAGDADWWEIIISGPNTNKRYIGVAVMPATSSTLGGAITNNQTGTTEVANVELYSNTAKEDVSGGPVYT